MGLPSAVSDPVTQYNVEFFNDFISINYQTMDNKRTTDSKEQTPFQDHINVNLFFPGAQRRKLLDELKKNIEQGAVVITLTGEEGVGKTMICRMVEKEMVGEAICVYLPNTLESFDDVVRLIALEVGTDNADKPVSSKILVDEIAGELVVNEKRLVVLFDQAERMYLATIERVRKMLDRVNDDKVLLQIVFAGRESLLENLKQLAICNFKDVEEKHFSIAPLGLSETYAYLNHCARQRSSVRSKNIFTPEAAKKIFSMAQGNLRMTNRLAAKSLESAESDTSFMVLLDSVADENFQGTKKKKRGSVASFSLPWRWLGLAAGCLIIVLFFFIFRGEDQQSSDSIAKIPEKQQEEKVSAAEKDKDKETSREAAPKTVTQPEQADSNAQVEIKNKQSAKKKTAVTEPALNKREKPAVAEPVNKVSETDKVIEKVQPPGNKIKKQESSPLPVLGEETIANEGQAVGTEPENTETIADQNVKQEDVEQAGQVLVSPLSVEGKKPETQPAQEQGGSTAQQKIEEQDSLPDDPQPTVMPENEAREQEEVAYSGEPVVFVGMKKQLPPPETGNTGGKKIIRISPAKVKRAIAEAEPDRVAEKKVDTRSVEKLFAERLAAGERWLAGENGGRYTIQLMVLTADQAENNLKKRFAQEEYRRIADKLFIVKGNISTVFVYYGIYQDMDSARQARNRLPVFLRKHDPYAVSVDGAVAKAASEQ